MLREIDDLMEERDIDAVLCYGDTTLGNPELAYLTRAALPRGGIYFKKRGNEPLLVVSNIDVGSARKGGVKRIETFADYDYPRIVKEYGRRRAYAEILSRILSANKPSGRISLCGRNNTSVSTMFVDLLRAKGHRVVGEFPPTIVDRARSRKDAWEISSIKNAAKKTIDIVRRVERLLDSLGVTNGVAELDGRPVSVGDVKKMVRAWCSESRMTLPEDFIFATGRSSADPHESGNETQKLRTSDPIVFDIFPQDETGYWFDFTRTYVLGKASKALVEMYDVVREAQLVAYDHLAEGKTGEHSMNEVCEYFSSKGWLTTLDAFRGVKEASVRGFIHGLGHGVGLTIGEEPYLSLYSKEELQDAMVVTVEPALYVPNLGGVRLEDVVVVTKSRPEVLGNHPYELEH